MKSIAGLITGLLVLSCSSPKEIVKSENTLPRCHCEGEGDFTIVMEAGMGNWSLFYQNVFQALKKETRVCIIDRAGYAMKTVSTHQRDVKTIALEMDKVLVQNGIEENIILTGHSLGGLHVRMYQSLFPEKVEGMILLDAAHPDQFNRLPAAFHDLLQQQKSALDKTIELAKKDYLKYGKSKIPTFGMPDSLLSDYYLVTTQPEYYYSMKMEVLEFENNLKQVARISNLGELPLLIIASRNSMEEAILPGKSNDYPFEEHNQIWLELQKELSKLSTQTTYVESSQNHYLNITDSQLVIEQITLFLHKNFGSK